MFLINGDIWDLVFVNPFDEVLRNNDGLYTLGVTIPEWKTIFISDELQGELLMHVICHELTHAEFVSRGVYLPEYLEECFADIISDNIVDVENIASNIQNNLCRYNNIC